MRLLKYLLVFLLLRGFGAFAQTATPNIGFEDGTFNHWDCYVGGIDLTGKISVNLSVNLANRHLIIDSTYAGKKDDYTGIPMLSPNGSKYSLRLGSDLKGPHAERVAYSLTVPTGIAYSIVFNYAVVLVNPGHKPFEQPKFTVQVYDVTDDSYLDCPSFLFAASPDLPGFKVSTRADSVFFKDWSSATINLSHYGGKKIRLEFTTNACVYGAHFGYAYLDVNENIGSPISGNAYCNSQRFITLQAPIGFEKYTWYDAGLAHQVGSGQSLTLSPAPPNGAQYAVVVSPYLGVGCPDTLYTTVNKIDEGFNFAVQDTVRGCPGGSADLTAAAVTAGSSPGMQLSYFTDSLAINYLSQPDKVTTAGRYYIRGINTEGCMNILPVEVAFGNPQLAITDPVPVNFPTTVDISKTYTPQTGLTYSYYTDLSATAPLSNYAAINLSGTYYIKAANASGCTVIKPVHVTVTPPPPLVVTAPTAFTPNNDGVNDHFMVTVGNLGTFDDLKIYNRYGKLVFNTVSAADFWDGRYNLKELPAGTYYWVFEGVDNYSRTKAVRSGWVALIR